MSSSTSKTPGITPRRAMQGHTSQILDIAHLPGGRRIIICSADGSLRLWDLESDAQIGDAWQDEGHKADIKNIALSPSGETVASGSNVGTVRLWDIKTGKVVARWVGHTENVGSVCWNGDGARVVSGSWDGTARVWDVKPGKTVLEIKNGHQYVWAVAYSPDNTKFATGGENENAVKIWDARTGELMSTLHQDQSVRSLAWNGKKLFSASLGPIGIFDTVTWEQIAVLKGHVFNLSLARTHHLLASTSIWDEAVCLWNLKTNLPVCPPFQHDKDVSCLAFSADGKLLVTACEDNNVYLWDIYAILKELDLEDLLSTPDVIPGKSLTNSDSDVTRPAQSKNAGRVPLGFFDGMQGNIHSSASRSVHHPSPSRSPQHALISSVRISRAFFDYLPLLFRHSRPPTNEATTLQQDSRQTIFSRRSTPTVEVAAVRDKQALYVAPRPAHEKVKYMLQQQMQAQAQGQAEALLSQTQPTEVSTPPATNPTTPCAAGAGPAPIPLWARLVLFLCCASPPHADGH